MIYYKAVDKTTGKLLSLLQYDFKRGFECDGIPDYTVEYKIGEFVKGNIGKLFVYQDLTECEIESILNDDEVDLYECEVINPSYPDVNVFARPKTIQRFWNSPLQFWRDWRELMLDCGQCFTGAMQSYHTQQIVWVDSVKLTKKIEG